MVREQLVDAEWVDHPPGDAAWTCGSGYLPGGQLVLTAGCVVGGGQVEHAEGPGQGFHQLGRMRWPARVFLNFIASAGADD